MNTLVLNGSPRPHGNTVAMVEAFTEGAAQSGHAVTVVNVCRKHIAGCLACEYCHTKGQRQCIQKDDMQEVYSILDCADMIVLASPVYYHSFSGQLQCAINRIYALDKPQKLKKAALFLSSGSDNVYGGAIYEYQNSFLDYLNSGKTVVARSELAGSPVDESFSMFPPFYTDCGKTFISAKMYSSTAAANFRTRAVFTLTMVH